MEKAHKFLRFCPEDIVPIKIHRQLCLLNYRDNGQMQSTYYERKYTYLDESTDIYVLTTKNNRVLSWLTARSAFFNRVANVPSYYVNIYTRKTERNKGYASEVAKYFLRNIENTKYDHICVYYEARSIFKNLKLKTVYEKLHVVG